MSTHKNSVPYTASDIEKYRKGELSAREMHDLEQAALDDPFLADAIEGLIQHPTLPEDLTDLHERLETKLTRDTRRNRIISIQRRITTAAAVLLLLGIGYTSFYHHPDRPLPTTVAQQPRSEAKSAADTVASHYTPPVTPPATAALRHPATAAKHAADLSSEARSADKATALSENLVSPSTSNQLRGPANNQLSPSLSNRYLTLPSSNKALQSDTTTYRALGSVSLSNPIVVSGKVLDFQNHPLAGAFLALNNNSGIGTTTDDQGQFKISLHPFDTTRQLTVSMIGYDHTSLAVNALSTGNLQNNIIRLKPSTSDLDEVVIVGYGKSTEVIAPSEDSKEKLDTLWINATPVIGREAYLQYLNVAKKKLGIDSTIAGTETLSFIVSRDGTLSSFKIEQSLSPAHDAGIIRLVTDGPAWHLIRGKKVRASVTINF
jgi:hypothetical protein